MHVRRGVVAHSPTSRERLAAALDYARANEGRQSTLARQGRASTDVYQQTKSSLGQGEASVDLDKAAIAKAQLNLERTVIRSPANGWVTNLQAQLGDYANVGQKIVSVVDADSMRSPQRCRPLADEPSEAQHDDDLIGKHACVTVPPRASSRSRSSALYFTTYFLTAISFPATNHSVAGSRRVIRNTIVQ